MERRTAMTLAKLEQARGREPDLLERMEAAQPEHDHGGKRAASSEYLPLVDFAICVDFPLQSATISRCQRRSADMSTFARTVLAAFSAALFLSGCVETSSVDAPASTVTANIAALHQQTDTQVTKYASWDIPEYVKPDPNYATLRHHLRKQMNDQHRYNKYTVRASSNPYEFSFAEQTSSLLHEQIQTTSLLSYLYFDDGAVIYDEFTSKEMFGDIVNPNTQLLSNSLGKSMVSYVLGHAICAGFIESVDKRIDDWPLVENTVYENQRLIDLLNMRAGDEQHVHDSKGLLRSGRWFNVHSIKSFANNELRGSKPSTGEASRRYHYNGLVTNIIMNYVIHKTGGNFQAVLNETFQRKARIQRPVYFLINRGHGAQDGAAWYMFYATRYDYLRIARAMMSDWQNDTCVGKYLKTVYARAGSKGEGPHSKARFNSARYGGQFHIGYRGMGNRRILGMDGYGGQTILIDMDNSRIVVANSIHTDYDWRGLIYNAIQSGKLPR
jgi:hypothetical protein